MSSKVIRPKIPQWGGSFMEQNLLRLLEKPTLEQLEVFRQNAEDQLGENFMVDFFAFLFGVCLDGMPDLPPLTPAQHVQLYVQIIGTVASFSAKWAEEFQQRVKKGFNYDL